MATCSTSLRLDCPICKKRMTEPTAFQCLHFFCQSCVDDMKPVTHDSKTGYKCSICGDVTPVEDSNTMDFIPKLFSTEVHDTQNKQCDKCQKEVPTLRCLDCKENLCKRCQDNHNSWSILKHHKWGDVVETAQGLIDQVVFCSDHPENPIKLHCKDCQCPVCMLCVGKDHKGHVIETIDDALGDILPKVTEHKARVEEIITHNENTLSRTINHAEEIKKEYEELEKRIDEKYAEVIQKARADCKKAKDDLATQKAKEMDKLENFIKDLEMRLKSGKNTVSLTEASLQKTKDTSLLHTLQTNVTQRLTKSLEDRMSGRDAIRTIRADFEPTDISTENCVGQITEVLCKSRHINRKLTEINEIAVTKTIETGFRHARFAMIGDELWVVEFNTNKIHTYSFDGEKLGTYDIENVGFITCIAKLDTNIVLASTTGLYVIDTNGIMVNKIMGGFIADVDVFKDKVYALNNKKGQIQVFRYEDNERCVMHMEFSIHIHNERELNTIHVTPASIYVAQSQSNNITKYSHTGGLIETFDTETQGMNNKPMLCGGDTSGNILVASYATTNQLQVLTSTGAVQDLRMPEIVQPICAAVLGNTLFVLQCEDKLIQYSIK